MDENNTVKLAIKSLLEVVQTGAKNIEIAVMTSDNTVKVIMLIVHSHSRDTNKSSAALGTGRG